jgi:hypothetical protein
MPKALVTHSRKEEIVADTPEKFIVNFTIAKSPSLSLPTPLLISAEETKDCRALDREGSDDPYGGQDAGYLALAKHTLSASSVGLRLPVGRS